MRQALVVSVAAGQVSPMRTLPPGVQTNRVRRIAPGRVLCWQLALALAAVAMRQSWPVLAALGCAAAALVLAATVRHRGRPLYRVVTLRCRLLYRTRRRHVADARSLLAALRPGAAVHPGQDSTTIVTQRTVVASIIRPHAVTASLLSSFPAPADLLSAAGLPETFGVTTVFHADATPGAPRRVWLALELARTKEILADDEVIPLLHHGVRLIQRTLHEGGVRTEGVPEDAALAAITTQVPPGEIREGWRRVTTGPVSHACFALSRDDRPDLQRLTATLLSRSPGVAVTVTRTARRYRGELTSATRLHLAAPNPTAVDAAAGHAARLLSPTAIRLTRENGAHLAGIAASLPIGGLIP